MSTLLRTTLWLILGTWLGAWLLFAVSVAPTAFRTLPVQDAGRLVAPLLSTLHLSGLAAGPVLAAIGWKLARSRWLVWIPLVLAGLCALSEFGVTPAIAEVRPLAFGEGSHAEAAARFALLHSASRFLYGLVAIGLLILVALNSRADAHGTGIEGASPRSTLPHHPDH